LPTLTLKNEKNKGHSGFADPFASEKVLFSSWFPRLTLVRDDIQLWLHLIRNAMLTCPFRSWLHETGLRFRNIYPDFTSVNFDVYLLECRPCRLRRLSGRSRSGLGDSYCVLIIMMRVTDRASVPIDFGIPERILISALGAGECGRTQRSHFIFGKGGKLLDVQESGPGG